jgi:hypothetical protein
MSENVSHPDRAGAVAVAAAHEFNDELTVILNSVTRCLGAIEPGHPSRALLLDLLAASQRCVWKAAGLLSFGARRNTGPVRASLESLIGR